MLPPKPQGHRAHTRVETTQVVMPGSTNIRGTVFGGEVMSWIDICAAVSAQRHCRTSVVTASMDEVHFLEPIKLGYVVILESMVNAVFSSSMEVGTHVVAENPITGERRLAVLSLSTFVSLDEKDRPKKCPVLIVESEEDKAIEAAAQARRARRLAHRRQQKREHDVV